MTEPVKDKRVDQTPPPKPKLPERRDPPRIFWCGKTRGFFSSYIHKTIPEEAVEITVDEWNAVLQEHATTGKEIVSGQNGKPVAVDPVITPAMRRRSIEAQIEALRSAPETLDAQRGVLLGKPGAKEQLAAIDAQIEALRATLPT